MGGATPAVCEPSPNCWSVFASSFPVGFSPCASWNFLVASIVEASHFPFGFPANEPSFASACWISEMRSGVGAFWPRALRLDFFDDFARCEELANLEEADFLCAASCACAEAVQTPSPTVTNSVRARWVAFRTRIGVGIGCCQITTADCRPELCRTNRVSGSGRCPAGEEL
jgi:hypothetical protein